MAHLRSEAALEQVANGATLPGIVRASLAMPDIHQGYGLPVGGVVATDLERGVVSPGAIGFDINCGVRLVRTALDADAITPRLRDLVNGLYTAVPLGVGGKGTVSLSATTSWKSRSLTRLTTRRRRSDSGSPAAASRS